MLYRHIAVAVLACFLALPVAALDPGNVLIELREHAPAHNIPPGGSLWIHWGWNYASPIGLPLIYKRVPYAGEAGRTLILAPDRFIFHHENTVSMWNGRYEVFTAPGLGYTEIFKAGAELGEIAPMRSGNFLVAERSADRARGAKLIEFNRNGIVAEYPFPEVVAMPLTANRVLGASHIELLADQCTVLYTLGSDDRVSRPAVRRLNICTGQPEPDFAPLLVDEHAGSIRQLANGDIVVANGMVIHQFTSTGSLIRSRQFPGVTHLANAPDGKTFWAAGVYLEKAYLQNFDPADPVTDPPSVPFGNPGSQSLRVPFDITEIYVVGEWRASMSVVKSRGRAVRR
jgi:hypothetical protein